MSSACISRFARTAMACCMGGVSVLVSMPAAGQQTSWGSISMPPLVHSLIAAPAEDATPRANVSARPRQPVSRGPLARLVPNPDPTSGLPPYALSDQTGVIQRYVEPVPGIDLRPFVGQVVVVRHDTGRTLLASQLELPPQPLTPLNGEAGRFSAVGARPSQWNGITGPVGQFVQQAQYADDDDTTVELLEDGEFPSEEPGMRVGPMPVMTQPVDGYPMFPGNQVMPSGPGFGVPCNDPMQCGPATGMGGWPSEYGTAPCPHCGGYHGGAGFDQTACCGADPSTARQPMHWYANVEINFLRLHVMEDSIGKLSEKYEFSPRFVVGFSDVGPLSGRVRYWVYGRETGTLGDDDASADVEFDVWDFEGTHRFGGKRSEVILAAGLRLVKLDISDDDGDDAGTDLMGITMAADGSTRLFGRDAGRLAWVYGGRLSILGGDWGGEGDSDFLDHRVRDDNVIVHELYAGFEYACLYRGFDLSARLAFELQNWHSDVLAENADDTSLGIVGPGLRLGAQF